MRSLSFKGVAMKAFFHVMRERQENSVFTSVKLKCLVSIDATGIVGSASRASCTFPRSVAFADEEKHNCGQPCDKTLSCGHSCEGGCGEECPPCNRPCPVSCCHLTCGENKATIKVRNSAINWTFATGIWAFMSSAVRSLHLGVRQRMQSSTVL